jgi:hypothetical protein
MRNNIILLKNDSLFNGCKSRYSWKGKSQIRHNEALQISAFNGYLDVVKYSCMT